LFEDFLRRFKYFFSIWKGSKFNKNYYEKIIKILLNFFLLFWAWNQGWESALLESILASFLNDKRRCYLWKDCWQCRFCRYFLCIFLHIFPVFFLYREDTRRRNRRLLRIFRRSRCGARSCAEHEESRIWDAWSDRRKSWLFSLMSLELVFGQVWYLYRKKLSFKINQVMYLKKSFRSNKNTKNI